MSTQKKIYLAFTCILLISIIIVTGIIVTRCGKTAPVGESNPQIDTSRIYKCVIGIEDDKNNGWWTEIYEEGAKQFFADKFGLDVVFRRYNPNASPENNLFGNNAIDLWISMTLNIPDNYKEGYFLDMNEYRNQMPDYWNKWMEKGNNWERNFMKYASIVIDDESNKLYGLPSISNFSFPSLVWMFKEDAFTKYGIGFPSTIEELYQVLLDLKEKTGNAPIWFYNSASFEVSIALAYGTMPSSFYMDTKENEYKYAPLDKTWLAAKKMTLNMQNDGIVIIGNHTSSEKIDENAIVTCALPASLNYLTEQDASWKLVPHILTGESSDTAAKYMYQTPPNKLYCINANSDDEVKKRLIAFINWLATDEGIMKAWFGEEEKTFKLNNNIIEITFQGFSHVDCEFGVMVDDMAINQRQGKFKEFYNIALGRPFFIAAPEWKYYKGEELKVYTEAIEIMKDASAIETIGITKIKTNEKYYNMFYEIMNRQKQFLSELQRTGTENIEEYYKSFIEDIEKEGIHELLDYLNNND
jgi:hypothetical protein